MQRRGTRGALFLRAPSIATSPEETTPKSSAVVEALAVIIVIINNGVYHSKPVSELGMQCTPRSRVFFKQRTRYMAPPCGSLGLRSDEDLAIWSVSSIILALIIFARQFSFTVMDLQLKFKLNGGKSLNAWSWNNTLAGTGLAVSVRLKSLTMALCMKP